MRFAAVCLRSNGRIGFPSSFANLKLSVAHQPMFAFSLSPCRQPRQVDVPLPRKSFVLPYVYSVSRAAWVAVLLVLSASAPGELVVDVRQRAVLGCQKRRH